MPSGFENPRFLLWGICKTRATAGSLFIFLPTKPPRGRKGGKVAKLDTTNQWLDWGGGLSGGRWALGPPRWGPDFPFGTVTNRKQVRGDRLKDGDTTLKKNHPGGGTRLDEGAFPHVADEFGKGGDQIMGKNIVPKNQIGGWRGKRIVDVTPKTGFLGGGQAETTWLVSIQY